MRHRYRTGDVYGLTQQELKAMRAILRGFPGEEGTFCGELANIWYQRWLVGGEAEIQAAVRREAGPEDESHIRLTVHRLPFDYRSLGLPLGVPV